MDNLKEVLLCAIQVNYERSFDVETEDGTFATTGTDAILCLENALETMFDTDIDTIYERLRNQGTGYVSKQLEKLS